MSVESIADDIRTMRVRGAGRIARATAQALAEWSAAFEGSDPAAFREGLRSASRLLYNTRPTAVSLGNALRFVNRAARSVEGSVADLREAVQKAAAEFCAMSEQAVETIAEIGARQIGKGEVVHTHCNSSVAVRTLIRAHEMGKEIRVHVTESRPRYQGHITARELAAAGVPVTLMVDSAARFVMGKTDRVIVGADTVTSNGSVVNKIGTSQIALVAHEARVPVFVVAESYKFSPRTLMGEVVEIEEREPEEVADPAEFPGVRIYNPAFDMTPAEYVTAIVTEKGIISPYAAYELILNAFGEDTEFF